MNNVEKAKQSYEDALRMAKIEDELEAHLPTIKDVEFKFHIYPLFGTVASVSTNKKVTLEQLIMLVAEFKPMPMYHHKGSCTSFQSEKIPKYESDTVTEVSPYLISYSKMVKYDYRTEVSWFTMFGEKSIRVQIELEGQSLGRIDYIVNNYVGGFNVDTRRLISVPACIPKHETIRWAGGGRESINPYSIHFKKGIDRMDFIKYLTSVLDIER